MTSMNKCLLAVAAMLVISGCASTGSTRYYTLARTAPMVSNAGTTGASPGKPAFFELGPVAVPDRLARPHLVIHQPSGTQGATGERVLILEEDRWSSPFNIELRDALASGVARRIGAIDVTRGGRPRGEPIYRIAVQLQQFEAVAGARVDATFSWTIAPADGSRYAACVSSLSEPVGAGTDALVQGVGRVVDRIADSIATDVRRLQAGQGGGCQASGEARAASGSAP